MKILTIINDKLITRPAERLRKRLIDLADMDRARKEFNKKISHYSNADMVLTTEQEAIIFAQCIQLQFLKSPSSAVFSELDDFKVEKKNNIFVVSGEYEAQNSYGGLKREQFQIQLLHQDDTWAYYVDGKMATRIMRGIYISIMIILGSIIFISI